MYAPDELSPEHFGCGVSVGPPWTGEYLVVKPPKGATYDVPAPGWLAEYIRQCIKRRYKAK